MKIEHIIGEGPELADSQRRVLEVLEKHPDHLFRLYKDDLVAIQRWMNNPASQPVPTKMNNSDDFRSPKLIVWDTIYELGTIRWAIHTLYHRGKIGSIVLNRRTYYGSHEAVKRAGILIKKRIPKR